MSSPLSPSHWPPMGPDSAAATGKSYKREHHNGVAAVFIHAGAGYHSTTNEKTHLEACSDAAKVAMKFLINGATATDAVEIAIKSLEDKEITNAGYGSNLNMDGVVECDATIVDHMGRSGACGAVPNIKNPISLAKLILESSRYPLSLRRVPPNILVGEGAREFARSYGMRTVDNEALVSKNAKDRFLRWSQDLKAAEASPSVPSSQYTHNQDETAPGDYEKAAAEPTTAQRRDHLSAILTATWNEGQPDSPRHTGTPVPEAGGASPSPTPPPSQGPNQGSPQHHPSPRMTPASAKSPLSFMSAFQGSRAGLSSPSKRPQVQSRHSDDSSREPSPRMPATSSSKLSNGLPHHDSSMSPHDAARGGVDEANLAQKSLPAQDAMDISISGDQEHWRKHEEADDAHQDLMDLVTDTVGAIAIDLSGNIAAGSSSGGIGMKHKGRIGPAALVGIGTAVLPEDPEDEDLVSVAAVTSGTGEHMATTLASHKCAERLRHGTRRGRGGADVAEEDEDAVMEAFIVDDFMRHPGVRNQSSQGAIGVMAVKKARAGYYFYFAHNTDSFALASIASTEREPLCVMSRLGDVSEVARGARKIRID